MRRRRRRGVSGAPSSGRICSPRRHAPRRILSANSPGGRSPRRVPSQAERPFLFPPKFTFVFRAFSTIDGIGKTLQGAKYDLARISQPYLRELANLRDGSTTKTAVKEVGRRLGLRPEDLEALVTQPRAVASLAKSVRR